MKKLYLYVIAVSAFLFGCEKIDVNDVISIPKSSGELDPLPSKAKGFSFSVSLKTAKYFAETQNPEKNLKSIEPVVLLGDTVMYVVNYEDNGGWIVLSGDKRFEPVLSIHESGNFNNSPYATQNSAAGYNFQHKREIIFNFR